MSDYFDKGNVHAFACDFIIGFFAVYVNNKIAQSDRHMVLHEECQHCTECLYFFFEYLGFEIEFHESVKVKR